MLACTRVLCPHSSVVQGDGVAEHIKTGLRYTFYSLPEALKGSWNSRFGNRHELPVVLLYMIGTRFGTRPFSYTFSCP